MTRRLIMLVDDELSRMTAYIEELEFNFSEHELLYSDDPSVALQIIMAEHHRLDCVILDLVMPVPAAWGPGDQEVRYTGIRLLERLRAGERERELAPLRVIILTNYETGALARADAHIKALDIFALRGKLTTLPSELVECVADCLSGSLGST